MGIARATKSLSSLAVRTPCAQGESSKKTSNSCLPSKALQNSPNSGSAPRVSLHLDLVLLTQPVVAQDDAHRLGKTGSRDVLADLFEEREDQRVRPIPHHE